MYSIKNMSFKDYIKDRTYLYFKPLSAILCCIKIKNRNDFKKLRYTGLRYIEIKNNMFIEQECNCPINIFTDNIVKTLKKQDFSYTQEVESVCEHILISKVETVNVLSSRDIELIRRRHA